MVWQVSWAQEYKDPQAVPEAPALLDRRVQQEEMGQTVLRERLVFEAGQELPVLQGILVPQVEPEPVGRRERPVELGAQDPQEVRVPPVPRVQQARQAQLDLRDILGVQERPAPRDQRV